MLSVFIYYILSSLTGWRERVLLQNMGVVNLLNMGYFKLYTHTLFTQAFLAGFLFVRVPPLRSSVAAHP